eukprot:COSAG06_NODE_26530_length_612_cov_13.497076_1_plen_88_part_10
MVEVVGVTEVAEAVEATSTEAVEGVEAARMALEVAEVRAGVVLVLAGAGPGAEGGLEAAAGRHPLHEAQHRPLSLPLLRRVVRTRGRR